MGSFVQDFTYDPDYYQISAIVPDPIDGYLTGEDDLFLYTDKDEYIEILRDSNPGIGQIYPDNLLDENNGKICNTPDFPEELYPDGSIVTSSRLMKPENLPSPISSVRHSTTDRSHKQSISSVRSLLMFFLSHSSTNQMN